MRVTLHALACVATLFMANTLSAQGVDALTNTEATKGLREALSRSTQLAVEQLGKQGGFLDNERVRIPLPRPMARVESGLRMLGMQKQADELRTKMNQAAELAVKEAAPVFADSIKKMSIKDAKDILTGGETAATDYFKRTTSDQLRVKFQPIVKKATQNVALADTYNKLAAQGSALGLVDAKSANIESYVTEKALDGLFLTVAEQEKAIRADPVGQASKLLQKVFGAVR